ncbi:hypothetical protein [Streptomyces sp. NPDC007083]|uniref:hypothetical protein n=1 Tax=Streptomyces sp. NPDC007083 TaxID=3156913 RepID=UPI0033F5C1D8
MGIPDTTAGSRKKARKKKLDELLSSVVRETAIPAAVELLRSNAKFVFPSGTAWVMLVLAADAIGGLSKRHGRNEAKGSIIELIDSDQIETVATAEMLGEEVFGIIPSDGTLARMEEYSLLTGAKYGWAVVWQKPSGDLLVELVSEATFAQAKAVATGSMSLEEAVGAQAWTEHSGVSNDALTASAGVPTGVIPAVKGGDQSGAGGNDEDAIFDPAPGDDVGGSDDSADDPVFEDSADSQVLDDEPIGFGFDDEAARAAGDPSVDETGGFEEFDADDSDGLEAWPQDDDVVLLAHQEQVRDVIARRFMSEDLDLDVRLDEFNAIFAIGAPVVQMEMPQGATEWLGDQIAQLNRQANANLAQMRSAHEDELRTTYVTLMSRHVESVIRSVATDREGSRYKALKEAAEAGHAERRAEKERSVRDTRAQIAKDYEAQAKRLAEQAAIQAEVQFKERNRAKMERDQADAVAEIDRNIENAYSHDVQEILRVRRSDAALQMQVGATRIFEVLAERQSEYLAAEQERLGQWKAEIQRVVHDNRKADIAQAEAWAEHHRTTDEVGILRREQDALVESLRSEHADRIRQLEDELERNRRDAVAAMQARDAEWQHSLNLEKKNADSQAARVADLFLQMGTVEATIDGRYRKTIEDLKNDRESASIALVRANAEHSRSSKVLVLFMVAIGLVCGGTGWIAGSGMG